MRLDCVPTGTPFRVKRFAFARNHMNVHRLTAQRDSSFGIDARGLLRCRVTAAPYPIAWTDTACIEGTIGEAQFYLII